MFPSPNSSTESPWMTNRFMQLRLEYVGQRYARFLSGTPRRKLARATYLLHFSRRVLCRVDYPDPSRYCA